MINDNGMTLRHNCWTSSLASAAVKVNLMYTACIGGFLLQLNVFWIQPVFAGETEKYFTIKISFNIHSFF